MEHLPPARPFGLGRKELVAQPRGGPNQRPRQCQKPVEVADADEFGSFIATNPIKNLTFEA